VVPCSAEAELALRRASQKEFVNYKPGDSEFRILNPEGLTAGQKSGLEKITEKILRKFGSTGVQEALNFTFFNLLKMIPVYPVEDSDKLSDHNGRVLPDCYLIPEGTTARELASAVHSELGENFIYAVEVRTKRRLGEDYALRRNDVIKIVSAKARA
jgi:ribosome-binding ATPase YchF (GTP1/OBG family)